MVTARNRVTVGALGLSVVIALSGCGEAPATLETRSEPTAPATTRAVGPVATEASSTTTPLSITTTLPPAPVISSWDDVLGSTNTADAYAQAQADYAGTWVDKDLEVLYYAFTGDVPRHASELRARGVDMDSGFYELRKANQSWDELTAAYHAALADWDNLAEEWHVIEIKAFAQYSAIVVVVDERDVTDAVEGIPSIDWDRLDALDSYLGSSYGTASWAVIPATPSMLSELEQSISTAERNPTADPEAAVSKSPTTTTVTAVPVQTVKSWGYIFDFTDTTDTYAEAQPDYAGTWVDEDLQVLYYAFTDNLPYHEAQLRALGVDMDSGFYELHKVYLTLDDMDVVFERLKADQEKLKEDWDILGFNVQVVENVFSIVVDEQAVYVVVDGTPTLDLDRLNEVEAHLTETYGVNRWSIGPGRDTEWGMGDETL